jgi:hypothetical protein
MSLGTSDQSVSEFRTTVFEFKSLVITKLLHYIIFTARAAYDLMVSSIGLLSVSQVSLKCLKLKVGHCPLDLAALGVYYLSCCVCRKVVLC